VLCYAAATWIATILPILAITAQEWTKYRPICLREESHMSNSTTVPAQSTAEQINPYRPLGIKAVIAAALMLKPKQALKPAG
jgi:hypothetical protein